MSLPRPRKLYRINESRQQPQEEPSSSGATPVAGITSFLTLVFELDVHLFSDSFHVEARPARAGEGGTFSVRHFQLQFDDLGFKEDDTYADGRQMRGGSLSRGHRVITKHVSVENEDIRSTVLDNAKVLRPLVQELRVLAHPPLRDHQNIIDLFGVAWEKRLDFFGQPWPILVLEYASGGSLTEFFSLNQNENTWSTSLGISQDIASGLSSLHGCGVIHADLKPENVLIVMDSEDRPIAKVCDFGFAIIKSDYPETAFSQTVQVQLTGFTPRWLAPEGRHGRVPLYQAHMIDVYAFGLVFAWIVMEGKDPFEVDGKALSLEKFQSLQDGEDIAGAAMGNINRLGYGTEKTDLISTVLHGILVSTPDRRRTLELVRRDLEATMLEDLSDGEKSTREDLSDPVEAYSIQNSSTEPDSVFDSEVPPPFFMGTVWPQGLFEPDAENLDELLHMPLVVQVEVYKEIKKNALGGQGSTESHIRSEDCQLPIIREVADVAYLLYTLLFEGIGGTQNLDEAVRWLIISAKAGCQRARLDLPRTFSAYKFKLPADVQMLVPGWVAQEALAIQDRFSFDTLEGLDKLLFATTIKEVENKWRLCTDVSDLWGIEWFGALLNAYADLYNFIHRAKITHSPGLGELGILIVSHATANMDQLFAFLFSMMEESAALRDYGSGLGWIHFLANFGIMEALQKLLENSKVDIQKPDFQGRTPLYFATICGNPMMVEFLLDRGAQASFGKDKENNTCLHFVTSFRRVDIPRIVERLVKAGGDVNSQNSKGSTPLHMALMQTASATSNFSATEALLRCGADPCIVDSDGEMPHYWAVVLLQPEALAFLLKVTQDRIPNSNFLALKANLFDHLITVPQIDMASFAGSRFPQCLDEIVQLLLDGQTLEAYKTLPDNGGDSAFYSASGRGKLELMRSICRCCPSVNVNEGENEYNRPAIQCAIRHNKRSVIEALLTLGANLFYRDLLGENALHVAATYAPELIDLILELSRKANNVEEMIESTSIHGLTPLDKAIVNGYLDTAQVLIDFGASCDQLRCLGEAGEKMTTLGHILSLPSASQEQVDFLLQFDLSFIVSKDDSTVFHALAKRSQDIRDEVSTDFEGDSSRLRIFDILYRVYPKAVFCVDSKGRTPLHLASWNVLFDLVVRLGQVGVDVNSKDHEGMTALDHLRSRRTTQKFESPYLLLRRNFEKEMDQIEAWLWKKMHETT